jgi:hypothetical protein
VSLWRLALRNLKADCGIPTGTYELSVKTYLWPLSENSRMFTDRKEINCTELMPNYIFPIAVAILLLAQCTLSCPEGDTFIPIHHESNGTHHKRAYRIEETHSRVLWENGRITYCFADDTARDRVGPLIPNAWETWLVQGANKKLDLKVGTTEFCQPANRQKYLLVKYNSQRRLRTSLGRVRTENQGSEMDIDPSDGIGMGSEAVYNVAHELGHAWGFLHEHQRPSLWTPDYGGTAQQNTFTFTCQNLKDYSEFQAEKSADEMRRLCHYYMAASRARFSAMDFLPDIAGQGGGIPGQVDWDSIMLYGSTAGGSTVNGHRLTTLAKADGSTFGYNEYPSQQDVAKLNEMYARALGTKKATAKMYWKKASAKSSRFFQDISNCQ